MPSEATANKAIDSAISNTVFANSRPVNRRGAMPHRSSPDRRCSAATQLRLSRIPDIDSKIGADGAGTLGAEGGRPLDPGMFGWVGHTPADVDHDHEACQLCPFAGCAGGSNDAGPASTPAPSLG